MLAEYTVTELDHCSYWSWQMSCLVRSTLSFFTGLLAALAACDLGVSKLPGVLCQPRSKSLMQSTLCCPDRGVLACLVCTVCGIRTSAVSATQKWIAPCYNVSVQTAIQARWPPVGPQIVSA